MSAHLNIPVLIYISREGCPACQFFESQWNIIKKRLDGKARFIKFLCTATRPPPPCINKWSTWFPSIILADPRSYFRCFTPDDKVNVQEYDPNYVIEAVKFNAVETETGFEYAGRPNTAEAILTWFGQVAHTFVNTNTNTQNTHEVPSNPLNYNPSTLS